MRSELQYLLALFSLLTVWMAYSLRAVNWRDYFKTKTGLGILKGILMAVGFSIAMVGISMLSGCSGTYLNSASVFTGMDYTNKVSPMCKDEGPDSHTTSNLGLKGNLYKSQDKSYNLSGKYTHHSCAFSPDAKSYDAVGIELEYVFMGK